MASTEAIKQVVEPVAAKPGLPLVPLVVSMLAAVLIAVGGVTGVAFWLYKTGKLPGLAGSSAAAKAPVDVVKPTLVLVPLDPLLVNLADVDGRSYLRVAITLVTEQKPLAKDAKPKQEKPEKGKATNEFEAAERDALLSVLGSENGEALLAPQGKDLLKQHIRAALKQRVPDVIVDDVLFTDFLVQR